MVNEPSELVPLLRAADTEVKRKVLQKVSLEWISADEIKELYGAEGEGALLFFEKIRLVETRWSSADEDQEPKKTYHTYYSSFNITLNTPVIEFSDVLGVAVMGDEEFSKYEKLIFKEVGKEGKFVGDISESLDLTQTMLRSLVKRSTKVEYRGHRVERIK